MIQLISPIVNLGALQLNSIVYERVELSVSV